ncbi:unnamed protein product, partial [marine sediment metagenome]
IEGGFSGDMIDFYFDYSCSCVGSYPYESGATTIFNIEVSTGGYQIQLYGGWNLIGIPFIPEDPSIDVMLYNIMDYVESVWAYDGETGFWSSYSSSAPSDLNEILDGKGYWIKVSADVLWYLDIE